MNVTCMSTCNACKKKKTPEISSDDPALWNNLMKKDAKPD